jgi:hypothetical protein
LFFDTLKQRKSGLLFEYVAAATGNGERKMKKALLILFVIIAGGLQASVITINITPSQVPDENLPAGNLGDAPTGFGPDSWQNTQTGGKVNWHARYNADGDFLTALFPAQAATLTINDIASVSYWTKRPNGTAAAQDWAAFIYTRTDGINDKTTWYGYRFINNYGEHTNHGDWVQYSTDSGMTFRDNAGNAGGFSGKTLDYLKTNYGTELIEMISIQTMSNYTTFNGYMDGLTITLADGSIGTVNFVPEPMTLLLLGLGGLGLLKRK